MVSRRAFLKTSIATFAASGLTGCSSANMTDYQQSATELRAALTPDPSLREFIRYATLAANGHNTQPWLFKIGAQRIAIAPDFAGRTEVVDPDDHHLFVSLGCAAENFAIAAAAHGRPTEISFDPSGDGVIDVDIANGAADRGDLYQAIPMRQSTRSEYDGRKVPVADLEKMRAAAAIDGVNLQFFTEENDLEQVLNFIVAGNSAQMEDPSFVQELKDWIRFNPSEALRTSDGLFSACTGNPTIPTWFGNLMFGQFFKKDTENEKYATQIRSSAGVAVFTGAKEDRDHWIKVGRSFQRFALQATALGIRNAHVNQPIEVPSLRPEFAGWLGARESRPDLIIRFGYAPALPMSMRRPVEAVIASTE
ncbi:MAG: Tat pathway signal protein [Pseudomonadota bacterium]